MFTLLRNANVFDPEPRGRRDLLVCAAHVVAIEERLEAPRGLACETIDLDGRPLVPGLVDAHVHVTGAAASPGPPRACRPSRSAR
ncbi:MAG: hypothetical protein M5U28_50125 [Sandaracinaceae bacterium]|nr:hypothetical protein [Sandaracinaceae bacterium]